MVGRGVTHTVIDAEKDRTAVRAGAGQNSTVLRLLLSKYDVHCAYQGDQALLRGVGDTVTTSRTCV